MDSKGKEKMVESKEWVLSAYASRGIPTSDHLKLRIRKLDIDSIPDGHVAMELLWLSVDPYLRSRMTGTQEGLYSSQFELNQVITAFGLGRVVRSKDVNYREGDIITNPFCPVAEFCVVTVEHLRKVDPDAGLPLPDYLSALGVPGFAAWIGIEVIGKAKVGENVFISAAAGGVGMYAGQLAKLKGCRVIGSTGADEKVNLLKESFGYDDAFNYNTETDFDAVLSKYFPTGIDIYLDNVGGKMLEAVLNHVNKQARIPLCGMISQYNQTWSEREGVRNLLNMVGKDVKMEGFLIGSYLDKFGDFAKEIEDYIKQGKITSKHKIYHGIESFLESLSSLFSSSNDGKVVTTFGLGKVVRSMDGNYKEGDIVLNLDCPVAEYCVVPVASLRKVDRDSGLPFPAYLSALGIPGLAAWVGIQMIGKPKPGENVFVSAAAGGVGMFAGQLAKLNGCRVIGSTGSDEKVLLLKERFGYDDAFNYNKETDFNAALSNYFPTGIDIYLDNVGGKMLEAVLNHVNVGARIPLCGMISQYNQNCCERVGVQNLLNMVGKEVKMEGFMIGSYFHKFGDFAVEMEGHMKQGKISSKHEIYYGIESFLESLTSMFTSSNIGKVVIQVKKDI